MPWTFTKRRNKSFKHKQNLKLKHIQDSYHHPDMLVQDDYQGIDPTLDLHWNMMTQASITLSPDGKHAQLKHDKQTMSLSIVQPAEARFSITDATPPTQSEHQNKNFQRLMINLPAPVSDGSITVQFVCGSTKTHHAILCKPLMQWCH